MATQHKLQLILEAVDKSAGDIKKLESQMGKLQNSTDKAGGAFGKLKGEILAMGAGFVGIQAGLSFLKGSLASFSKFEQAMSNINTLMGDNGKAVAGLQKGIEEMVKTIPVSHEELGSAAYDIVSAGIKGTADQLTVLNNSAILAVAGLGTVGEAADLVTSSINAFQLQGAEADAVYGLLFNTVAFGKTTISELAQGFGAVAGSIAAANISLPSYLAGVAALTTTGLPAAQAHTQLKAAVAGVTRESTELNSVLSKLNAGSFKELVDRAGGDMVKAFEDVTSEIKGNDAAILKLFGSQEAYNSVVQLTTSLQDKYQEALLASEGATEALSVAYIKQTQTTQAQMQIAKNEWEALKIKVGGVLSYIVLTVVKFVNAMVNAFNFVRKGIGLAMKAIVTGVAIAFGFAAKKAIDAVNFILAAIKKLSFGKLDLGQIDTAGLMGGFDSVIASMGAGTASAAADFKSAFNAMDGSADASLAKMSNASQEFQQQLTDDMNSAAKGASGGAGKVGESLGKLEDNYVKAKDGIKEQLSKIGEEHTKTLDKLNQKIEETQQKLNELLSGKKQDVGGAKMEAAKKIFDIEAGIKDKEAEARRIRGSKDLGQEDFQRLANLEAEIAQEKKALDDLQTHKIIIQEEYDEVLRQSKLSQTELVFEQLDREMLKIEEKYAKEETKLREQLKLLTEQKTKEETLQKEKVEELAKLDAEATKMFEDEMKKRNNITTAYLDTEIRKWEQLIARIQEASRLTGGGGGGGGGNVNIPAFASGGIVTRPTVGLIGEAGPEAIIPLSKGGGGAVGGITINITGTFLSDNVAEEVGDMIIGKLKDQIRL